MEILGPVSLEEGLGKGETLGRGASTEAVDREQGGLGEGEFGGVQTVCNVEGVVLIDD